MFHKFIAENPDGISESMQRTHLLPGRARLCFILHAFCLFRAAFLAREEVERRVCEEQRQWLHFKATEGISSIHRPNMWQRDVLVIRVGLLHNQTRTIEI